MSNTIIKYGKIIITVLCLLITILSVMLMLIYGILALTSLDHQNINIGITLIVISVCILVTIVGILAGSVGSTIVVAIYDCEV